MNDEFVHCPTGKAVYPNKAVARVKGARASRIWGCQIAVYRCEVCKHWHMSRILDGSANSRVVSGQRKPLPKGAA